MSDARAWMHAVELLDIELRAARTSLLGCRLDGYTNAARVKRVQRIHDYVMQRVMDEQRAQKTANIPVARVESEDLLGFDSV